MKRIVMLILAMSLGLSLKSQVKDENNPIVFTGKKDPKIGNLRYLDYKCGFKDFILGNDIKNYEHSLKDFNEIEDDLYKFYEVDSTLFINEIPIKRIILGVYENKIARIVVQIENEHGDNMYGILSAAYGGGYKNNRYMDEYYWLGTDVNMVYDFEGPTITNLIITSTLFDKRIEKQRRVNQKNAASDL